MIDDIRNNQKNLKLEKEENMRVIAGSAKRLQLETIEGLDTRPTTDRIKETLFNMIQPYIERSLFLDLFSGSGGIGIEALSRGAKRVWFVESQRKPMDCIKKNLLHTKLQERATCLLMDAERAILQIASEGVVFDFVYLDPPYGQGLEQGVLEKLVSTNIIDENTEIIVETDLDTSFDYLENIGLFIKKEKKYKTNRHLFLQYEKGENE